MTKMEFSPGPWVTSTSPDYFEDGAHVIRCNGNVRSGVVVCVLTNTPHRDDNASILAASLDLYRACAMAAASDSFVRLNTAAQRAIREALAKVHGENP